MWPKNPHSFFLFLFFFFSPCPLPSIPSPHAGSDAVDLDLGKPWLREWL